MEDYFKAKLKELHSESIKIHEVHLDIIHSHNSLIVDGYNKTFFNADGLVVAYIFIDNKLSWEQKINVLFHEYGHVIHKQSLGNHEIMQIKRKSDFDWNVLAEFEAFKYQLIKIKELEEEGKFNMLSNLINELEGIASNEPNEAYRNAAVNLMATDLWQESLSVVKEINKKQD